MSKYVRLALALASLVVLAVPGGAKAAATARYEDGGTAVVRAGGEPVVDNGAVVCRLSQPTSVGGGCVDFGPPSRDVAGVKVADDANGLNVAFQVCIDNNGDGICGGVQGDGSLPCGDDLYFSHADGGAYFNPVGPLPNGFRKGCAGGPWNGYVVLLCTGVHSDVSGPHVHQATTGAISSVVGAAGSGNFCGNGASSGASGVFVAKAYTVIS